MADNIFTDADGRLNIIQSFDAIKTRGFPTINPRICIVTKWELEKGDDTQGIHRQKLKIIKERTGEIIIETPEKELIAETGRGEYLQYITKIVGLKFDAKGTYKVQVYIDGERDKEEGIFKVIQSS